VILPITVVALGVGCTVTGDDESSGDGEAGGSNNCTTDGAGVADGVSVAFVCPLGSSQPVKTSASTSPHPSIRRRPINPFITSAPEIHKQSFIPIDVENHKKFVMDEFVFWGLFEVMVFGVRLFKGVFGVRLQLVRSS
jgi:hypothetical protein